MKLKLLWAVLTQYAKMRQAETEFEEFKQLHAATGTRAQRRIMKSQYDTLNKGFEKLISAHRDTLAAKFFELWKSCENSFIFSNLFLIFAYDEFKKYSKPTKQ